MIGPSLVSARPLVVVAWGVSPGRGRMIWHGLTANGGPVCGRARLGVQLVGPLLVHSSPVVDVCARCWRSPAVLDAIFELASQLASTRRRLAG